MQQSPLVETQSLSLAHRPDSKLDALDRTSRKNGPSFQGLRLPNTQTDSNQVDKLFTCRWTWSKRFGALTYFCHDAAAVPAEPFNTSCPGRVLRSR